MNSESRLSAEDILKKLQGGIAIKENPFDFSAYGWSSSELVKLVNENKVSGKIRRFGAVFDSGALGYKSTLCATTVNDNQLEDIRAYFADKVGVTHAYVREGMPNLWFTFTDEAVSFDDNLRKLGSFFENDIVSMPAVKRYKIRAVFDGRAGDKQQKTDLPPVKITEKQKEIIRIFQEDLTIVEDLFGFYAAKLKISEKELLEILNSWSDSGVLRRIAAVVRHRSIGVKGNAMCAWQVASDKVDFFGELLAQMPEVSHCYERKVPETFSFNLFAMIHGKNMAEVDRCFAELAVRGLAEGKKYTSIVELKKKSPKYFI